VIPSGGPSIGPRIGVPDAVGEEVSWCPLSAPWAFRLNKDNPGHF
jgi:hypothetical protein